MRKSLLKVQLMEVVQDTLPDQSTYAHLILNAGVMVVPVKKDAGEITVVMVEQYRHPLGEPSLEFPGGGIDPGEDPVHAARRELREETGYEADQIKLLQSVNPLPAETAAKTKQYLAVITKPPKKPHLDEYELRNGLKVVEFTQPELVSAILHGKIKDARTLAALAGLLFRMPKALARLGFTEE